MTYFGFTSLSTVGFGDYHPRNNFERVCCAILLLIGNALFGYIIGNFNEMVQEVKNFFYENDEADELNRFFMMMERFNFNIPFNKKIRTNIEKHFEFKWSNDKTSCVGDEESSEWMS